MNIPLKFLSYSDSGRKKGILGLGVTAMFRVLVSVMTVLFLGSCATNLKIQERLPRESFLLVKQKVLFTACLKEICHDGRSVSIGSGVLIASNGYDTYGITAGHVCSYPPPPKGVKVTKVLMTIYMLGGAEYDAEVMKIYDNVDVCILKIVGTALPTIGMSESPPRMGQKVFNLAAPLGIFNSRLIPTFDGYYAGRDSKDRDMYSIPVTGGSSGGPILDGFGNLLGIVSMKLVHFENLCLSPPYEAVRDIVRSVKSRAASERSKPPAPTKPAEL